MKKYKLWNNITGWATFVVSACVYLLTIEPTVSFWDCGEFIASSYKLLVGHPPGAPFFMLIGNFFTRLAPDVSKVALMANIMSALCSAFTIMFLFWTITHLAKKIIIGKTEEFEVWKTHAVMAAGIVGALAYTFSDTFWFSAVEGEVYAMSSLFTAVVFWAILKWENVANEPHSNRWIILIAYLMGLSIGVHLLNLLAIPAIVMIYYYRNYKVSTRNTLKALTLSAVILLLILYGIIPGVVKIASKFELMFVNGMGLPYNTGVLVFAILLIGALSFGIYYTYVKRKAVLNTILTAITVILFGYSSFALIVIRSSANPTMDQNSPEDVFTLMTYLNREQYGNRPLISGEYYNSPVDRRAMQGDEGRPVYIKKNNRYEIATRQPSYVFDSRTTTLFPRMYSREPSHIEEYKNWGRITGRPMSIVDDQGNPQTIQKPTFIENIRFFINYQVRFMYFRYFMWNFAGRQNDMQGHGEIHKGNWISGIPVLDNAMYGDQSKLPDIYKNNAAHNRYYMLPLLLGIVGLLFQFGAGKTGRRDFWVVMLLFLLTGLAIVMYLNQTPIQPRERDYAYAGSFYAFSIWIGLGVLAIIETLRKKINPAVATNIALAACFALVPGIMASENWDDHNRSHRYIARDMGYNYLNTIPENGVIYTNGDNDTFPLWYAQEVEGIRTDVRVCNLSYLQTDWYIDQMKHKAYRSDPLPYSFNHDQYVTGTRDYVWLIERIKGNVDLKEAMKFLANDSPRTKQVPGYQGQIEYLPAKSFTVPVDSAKIMKNDMVSERYAHLIDSSVNITLNKEMIMKNELMVLDLMAQNDWNRPVYYASSVGAENYAGLENYFQLEGFAYQITPIRTPRQQNRFGLSEYGRVDADKMYNNVMNRFRLDGFADPRVYLDENHLRMAYNLRSNLGRLATTLLEEGRTEMAVEVLDKTMDVLPANRIPHNLFSLSIIDGYYKAGEFEKGDQIAKEFAALTSQELDFFTSLRPKFRAGAYGEIQRAYAIYSVILESVENFGREDVAKYLREDAQKITQRLNFMGE
ncbi:MAG: DUF2723 domain-containing protein [Cytophagaceae bacterium]|jgi:phage shock protein PspC (stress-responsive transcriptional regulator)|nr:DUF2723 domain-containing protein [Cytophagaceae bacterium]